MVSRKKPRINRSSTKGSSEPFEKLPDDLVICILSKLSASASRPSDFISALFVYARLLCFSVSIPLLLFSRSHLGLIFSFLCEINRCKRFNKLGLNQFVLSKASSGVFAIKAKNWSESAHRFLRQCVHAGSVEASYFLGMVIPTLHFLYPLPFSE